MPWRERYRRRAPGVLQQPDPRLAAGLGARRRRPEGLGPRLPARAADRRVRRRLRDPDLARRSATSTPTPTSAAAIARPSTTGWPTPGSRSTTTTASSRARSPSPSRIRSGGARDRALGRPPALRPGDDGLRRACAVRAAPVLPDLRGVRAPRPAAGDPSGDRGHGHQRPAHPRLSRPTTSSGTAACRSPSRPTSSACSPRASSSASPVSSSSWSRAASPGWPALLWRLDAYWKALRSEVPWVKRPPSEYVREHVRLASQPIERPDDDAQFLQLWR